MNLNRDLLSLFFLNFSQAYRSSKLLIHSLNQIKPLMLLNSNLFQTLKIEHLDALDAFRVRFCDVQDALGNKTFRSILLLEEEILGTNLDMIHKMEKRNIIPSADRWKELRAIRNAFSHDYPNTDDHKIEILNLAYSHSCGLINTLNQANLYAASKLNLDMSAYSLLTQE